MPEVRTLEAVDLNRDGGAVECELESAFREERRGPPGSLFVWNRGGVKWNRVLGYCASREWESEELFCCNVGLARRFMYATSTRYFIPSVR